MVLDFKSRWNISQEQPLHGGEIRSKKKGFAWLGKLSKVEQQQFLEDLTQTIISCPIVVHACVISRQRYLNRYRTPFNLPKQRTACSSASLSHPFNFPTSFF